MKFLGEPLNVIPEGLNRLLWATLQIPGVARLHVCALQVFGKDLLVVLLAINRISGQVVERGPSCVGQVNGEKLDQEEVIIHHALPMNKVVFFQPNFGVSFAIILDDVA
jgi:hypothetical protein